MDLIKRIFSTHTKVLFHIRFKIECSGTEGEGQKKGEAAHWYFMDGRISLD